MKGNVVAFCKIIFIFQVFNQFLLKIVINIILIWSFIKNHMILVFKIKFTFFYELNR